MLPLTVEKATPSRRSGLPTTAVTSVFDPGAYERLGNGLESTVVIRLWVYPKGNVYNATKFAVTALTEAINLDLAGTALKCSSVDPGFVETEFSEVRFHGDRDRAKGVYQGFQPLSADDVADAVAYVANLPPHANVLRMVLMPTAQRNAYVVDRKQV